MLLLMALKIAVISCVIFLFISTLRKLVLLDHEAVTSHIFAYTILCISVFINTANGSQSCDASSYACVSSPFVSFAVDRRDTEIEVPFHTRVSDVG